MSITASSTISELFDCSADSQSTSALSGRRRTSVLPSTGSNTIGSFRGLDPAAVGERGQHLIGKGRQRERVGQQAGAPPAPHARKRQLARQRGGGFVVPRDRQRQLPAIDLAVGVRLDLGEQHLAVAVGQRRQIFESWWT